VAPRRITGGSPLAREVIRITDSVAYVRISDMIPIARQRLPGSVAMELIEKGKKVRRLEIIEDFKGWEKMKAWGEVGFKMEHGNDIAR
jgi:hypothetical protein